MLTRLQLFLQLDVLMSVTLITVLLPFAVFGAMLAVAAARRLRLPVAWQRLVAACVVLPITAAFVHLGTSAGHPGPAWIVGEGKGQRLVVLHKARRGRYSETTYNELRYYDVEGRLIGGRSLGGEYESGFHPVDGSLALWRSGDEVGVLEMMTGEVVATLDEAAERLGLGGYRLLSFSHLGAKVQLRDGSERILDASGLAPGVAPAASVSRLASFAGGNLPVSEKLFNARGLVLGDRLTLAVHDDAAFDVQHRLLSVWRGSELLMRQPLEAVTGGREPAAILERDGGLQLLVSSWWSGVDFVTLRVPSG